MIGNPFLFTGRYYDSESKLYEYRQRMYDPTAGRFITRDPIGLWGDALNLGNPYTYAGNNPWTFVDPYGQDGIFSWIMTGVWDSGVSEWDVLFASAEGAGQGAVDSGVALVDSLDEVVLNDTFGEIGPVFSDASYDTARAIQGPALTALDLVYNPGGKFGKAYDAIQRGADLYITPVIK